MAGGVGPVVVVGGTEDLILIPGAVVWYGQDSWQTLQAHSCFQGLGVSAACERDMIGVCAL